MANFRNFKPLAFALSNSFAGKVPHHCCNGFVQPSVTPSPQQIFRTMPRLFGCKRGTPDAPQGKIVIYDEQKTIPDLDIPRIEETISNIREIIGYPTYDITLVLVDDDQMQETNMETRGVNKPTDILSFQFHEANEPGDLVDPPVDIPDYYFLGDMMLDVPYVIRRVEEDKEFYDSGEEEIDIEVDEDEEYVGDDDRGVSGVMATVFDPRQRIQLLLVHGMLHLVGYDHIEDDDYEAMVTKEEQVIKELQIRMNEDWVDIIEPTS